jgi:hypothetical protein
MGDDGLPGHVIAIQTPLRLSLTGRITDTMDWSGGAGCRYYAKVDLSAQALFALPKIHARQSIVNRRFAQRIDIRVLYPDSIKPTVVELSESRF